MTLEDSLFDRKYVNMHTDNRTMFVVVGDDETNTREKNYGRETISIKHPIMNVQRDQIVSLSRSVEERFVLVLMFVLLSLRLYNA